MSSHSRHGVTDVVLPRLFHPVEVAKALGCSEWWVKEQARRRRIPFTRVGGSYRFTAEHFAEIVRAFEELPLQPIRHVSDPDPVRLHQVRGAEPVVRLKARRPRRALKFQSPNVAC
ncbi:helix-turn-helix domain-containing protein [Streptomyces gamaensis]|uniref:Helix-turn-helix domain-containing protein n=1 Tax=Streptomyces gamaensis TaxID=1763542 RepID=A0ABW0Z424_9ACTN